MRKKDDLIISTAEKPWPNGSRFGGQIADGPQSYFHGGKAVAELKHDRMLQNVFIDSNFHGGKAVAELKLSWFPAPPALPLHFHGGKAVAELKPCADIWGRWVRLISTAEKPWPNGSYLQGFSFISPSCQFPRLKSRGRIEASPCKSGRRLGLSFPRLKSRGRIEAQYSNHASSFSQNISTAEKPWPNGSGELPTYTNALTGISTAEKPWPNGSMVR